MCDQRQLYPAGADFSCYGTTELHSCTFFTLSLSISRKCVHWLWKKFVLGFLKLYFLYVFCISTVFVCYVINPNPYGGSRVAADD